MTKKCVDIVRVKSQGDYNNVEPVYRGMEKPLPPGKYERRGFLRICIRTKRLSGVVDAIVLFVFFFVQFVLRRFAYENRVVTIIFTIDILQSVCFLVAFFVRLNRPKSCRKTNRRIR